MVIGAATDVLEVVRAIHPFCPTLQTMAFDPNAAGYAIMTPLVEKAIASLHVGGPR